MVSAANGHLDVVKALLEGGGRKLLMQTVCSLQSAVNGRWSELPLCQHVRQTRRSAGCWRRRARTKLNAGLSSHEITILKRG
jgi:hypothetical protein